MRWTDERRGGVQQNTAAFISPRCNGEITACRRCLKSALAELLFSVQRMWFGVTHTDGGLPRSSRAPFYIESTAILFFSPQPPELFHQKSLSALEKSVYSHHLSCRMRLSAGEFTSRADAFHLRALSLWSYCPAIFHSCLIYCFSWASCSRFACHVPPLLCTPDSTIPLMIWTAVFTEDLSSN